MTDGQLNITNFIPPGPVSAAFLNDRSPLSAIMGPMGSAKTSTCIMKTAATAQETPPSRITGERLFKWGVIRNTFTDLKRTTMKSIEGWYGKNGQWGGGGSAIEPPFFKVGFRMPDGTVCRLWMDFVGLDTHNIEQLAKGWEISAAWMNEADLMSKDVLDMVDGRTGRYPGKQHCDLAWYGVIMDYNAPDVENYLYKIFEEDRVEGHTLFKQPSGLSPEAENIQNLPAGYYERIARGKEQWWIRRNIHSQYGFSREGEPVYGEYNDDFHCGGRVLLPEPNMVVKVDCDQDLNCACVLRQYMPNGQLRILDELYSNRGAKGLSEQLLQLLGTEKYRGVTVKGGLCDPAGEKLDGGDAVSWIDKFNQCMGWTGDAMLRGSSTNDPATCVSAMSARLKMNVDDAQPGVVISATCKILRKGFNSTYCFKKRTNGTTEDKPTKAKPVSDVHNAAQFSAMDDGGYEAAIGREKRRARAAGTGMKVAKVQVRL